MMMPPNEVGSNDHANSSHSHFQNIGNTLPSMTVFYPILSLLFSSLSFMLMISHMSWCIRILLPSPDYFIFSSCWVLPDLDFLAYLFSLLFACIWDLGVHSTLGLLFYGG